jgi:Zn-dependent protease with chaperone function
MHIAPNDFTHPTDEAALDNLESIPLFGECSKAFLKVFAEEFFFGLNMAQKIRLGPLQLPKIYSHLPPICEKLGIDLPELYLEMNPAPNAYTYGDSKVFITVTSGLVEFLDEEELHAVIAHECGHIVFRHVLYHTMADMLTRIGSSIFGPFAAVSLPVQLALTHWARCSELSADRAAALVMGSGDPIMRTMIRLAGGSRAITQDVNLDLYLEQAVAYDALRETLWDRLLQGVAVMQQDHPFLAVRTREIRDWCQTGRFVQMAESLRVPPSGERCAQCGSPRQPGWKFCSTCGRRFDAAVA